MTTRLGEKYRDLAASVACPCCLSDLNFRAARPNDPLSRRDFLLGAAATTALGLTSGPVGARAEDAAPTDVLFENVRIFDGIGDGLSPPSNVFVVGSVITLISRAAIEVPPGLTLTRIQGSNRTLMPGLIDAHTHIMFATIPQSVVVTSGIDFVNIAAVNAARDMLLRGFTSIRDMGGPVFGLKRGIDAGIVPGPRIWPSGAFISQSGGHGDFRLPNDLPSRPGDYTNSERVGAAAIADDPGMVRRRVREQLALGASQIKMMAGGGVASSYDPLDVTRCSFAELSAAVEAAENWGTYVAVHAYTPKAVRRAIEAGVKCIDHGQLLDEATVSVMAEKDIWWSLQPFLDDQDAIPFPERSMSRQKQSQMIAGTKNAYRLARRFGIKTAWGTDTLFDAKLAA